MKIINIMQGTNLGGMEQASLRLMLGLKKLGHSTEVLSLNTLGGLNTLLQKHSIPAQGIPHRGKGGWRSILLLCTALREIKADALIMTGHHLLTMLLMGNLCKGKCVLAIHFHHKGVKPDWQWRLIYWLACKRFQAITFPSDFVRHEAEALYPLVKTLSHTVHNPLTIPPIADDKARREARQYLNLPEDALIVGNCGWLIPRKRFDIFLQVAQKVAAVIPNALFLIAGDGEEKVRLDALARDLNITDQVKWLGWQADLTPFYHSLDVMLFNSDWDAMGLSSLEAISFGIPLVASVQKGGLKEIINKEDYGFLIDNHDINQLANKVIYYLQNPEAAKVIALAGRQRVTDVSNPEQIVKKLESLLQGIDLSTAENS